MGSFKITADRFEWIGGVSDDPQDLCLHTERIAEERF